MDKYCVKSDGKRKIPLSNSKVFIDVNQGLFAEEGNLYAERGVNDEFPVEKN